MPLLIFLLIACANNCPDSADDLVGAWTNPPGNDWVQVAAARHNATCGRHLDGSVDCWGYDATQGLVPPGEPLTFIDVEYQVCGLTKGGGLACGDTWGEAIPTDVSSLLDGTRYVDVAVARSFVCALSEEGAIHCTTPASGLSVALEGPFVGISAADETICGLREAGSFSCWDSDGRLWTDSGEVLSTLDEEPSYGCGITQTMQLRCWKAAYSTIAGLHSPGPFVMVSAGDIPCTLDDEGAIRCWEHLEGEKVTPPDDGPFTDVVSGSTQVCGLRLNATISCSRIHFVGENDIHCD
jgi:hypothetical protein